MGVLLFPPAHNAGSCTSTTIRHPQGIACTRLVTGNTHREVATVQLMFTRYIL
jgi:hypothetical protein